MTVEIPSETQLDPKVEAILRAAFGSFAQYGFRRTSMEDIAKGAGISRPALYLHFRNKEDIFRALTAQYFDMACTGMEAALATDGTPAEQLMKAFQAKDAGVVHVLLSSPHGADLLDVKQSNSADIVAAGEARMVKILAAWVRRVGQPGGLADNPNQLARTILSAVIGLKASYADADSYTLGQRQIAQAFGQTLSR